jgi:hypothetical protein
MQHISRPSQSQTINIKEQQNQLNAAHFQTKPVTNKKHKGTTKPVKT